MRPTLSEVLHGEIMPSLARRNGAFGLAIAPRAATDKAFALAVGAPSAVQVATGQIVVVGLSAGQVAELARQCNEALASMERPMALRGSELHFVGCAGLVDPPGKCECIALGAPREDA